MAVESIKVEEAPSAVGNGASVAIPVLPDGDAFARLSAGGAMVPVFTQFSADFETPLGVYCRMRGATGSFLLESAESSETIGRYSFLGFDPLLSVAQRGRVVTVRHADGREETRETDQDPLGVLEALMSEFRPADVREFGLPLFTGGAVGYLGFECFGYFEPTANAAPPDGLGLPDAHFVLADKLVIFDHLKRRITLLANVRRGEGEPAGSAWARGRDAVAALAARMAQPVGRPMFNTLVPVEDRGMPESNTSRSEYHAMVEKAKEYIAAGDVFQVVPSQRFRAPFRGSPVDLYRALRHVNPSPYMFILEMPGGASLVGSSPEVHIRCIDGNLEIRPIAGTRWRGRSPQEDDALAADLLADPKERAEHLMLVDLARNDAGRVAETGTVKVRDFMVIERYSHVMHIVSHVEAKLRQGCTAYDAMRATFPAGTVSGAPKVRAVQIIQELEKEKRGVYAGAVGYFGFDGNHDSCIALRTAVIKDGVAHIQAGGGVVADSDPDYEHTESCNKARAMVRALATAGQLAAHGGAAPAEVKMH